MTGHTHLKGEELRLTGGEPPLGAELAELMPAAPKLKDRLVSEFSPTAGTLLTQ